MALKYQALPDNAPKEYGCGLNLSTVFKTIVICSLWTLKELRRYKSKLKSISNYLH